MKTASNNYNKQALTYGLLLAIIIIIINTIENMFLLGNFFAFYGAKVAGFIIFVVLMGVFSAQIRKAQGGYIEFKEVFRYIFIMILISELLYFIYTFIYFKYIDPHFLDKMKQATIDWMDKHNAPSDQIDKTADSFDQQIKEANKSLQLGKTALNYLSFVVLDSLFGLIVAAIVKKPRPMFDE